ncbi:MAG: sulfite exporter TauE/SafE family protein [Candidatus Omnitrophota bacterium]
MFLIGVLTFISEYLDSGLGMGYGTVLAPLLIMLGYNPLKVVPAILISQLFTDIAACVCHHNSRNVNLKFNSKDFKMAMIIGLISCVGVIISVIVAVSIPKWLVTFYIGLLVSAMGILILITHKKPIPFSWPKLYVVSLVASFNKGISGGGYGPLVMGGQLVTSVNAKSAVGITAFAEAITCLVGFIIYLLSGKYIDWKLIWILLIFAIPAVPLATYTVKHVFPDRLKIYVAVFIIILGLVTILKVAGG